MNRSFAVAQLAAMCLCVVMAVGCGGEEAHIAATPSATPPEATPASPQPASPSPGGTPATPAATDASLEGEEIEALANTVVRKVTWEDGTTYEGTISDLVFHTAGKPDAGQGHRVVASWLGNTRWQVTIFTHVVDRSTQPETTLDLRAEFYYDEQKNEFVAANGRALFALTGQDPCSSDHPEPSYCPLDQEVGP